MLANEKETKMMESVVIGIHCLSRLMIFPSCKDKLAIDRDIKYGTVLSSSIMHAQNVDCDSNAGNLKGFINVERIKHFLFFCSCIFEHPKTKYATCNYFNTTESYTNYSHEVPNSPSPMYLAPTIN